MDISDLDKAMIASIPSPAAAKIASTKDNVDKDKQITALTNLVNVMQNTVDAQSKNQVVLREAFEAEKISTRKFRDLSDKKCLGSLGYKLNRAQIIIKGCRVKSLDLISWFH